MVYVKFKILFPFLSDPLFYFFSGFHAMVLLLLPKSSTRSNKVHRDSIKSYELLTRYLLGFNMGNDLAVLVTYGAMLVDGNVVTNLLSIGGKSPKTGPDPPAPAIVGGLNTHGVFEGTQSRFMFYA